MKKPLSVIMAVVGHPAFLCGLSALLGVLGYPKFSLGVLGWFFLAPFTAAVVRLPEKRHAFLYGWLTGFLLYSGILYWIYYTCRAGEMAPPAAAAAWLALSLFLGMEYGLFAVFLRAIRGYGPFSAFIGAAGFAGFEWFKTVLGAQGLFLPWFMAGYTQWTNLTILQTASITGVFGISFLLAYAGISLAMLLLEKRGFWHRMGYLPAPVAAVAAALIFGQQTLSVENVYYTENIRVAVIQPNIDQYRKWDEHFEDWIKDRLSAQLAEAAKQQPHIVVWPESALPGWIEDPKYSVWVSSLAVNMSCYHVVGSVSRRKNKNYVSAFLFSPDGRVRGVYDKRQLVPFGEYVPFRGFLSKYIGVLGKLGEFEPGSDYQLPLRAGAADLGVNICYEAIFPYIARDAVHNGAQMLVNITNDGWYLDTAGPYQHFITNVFRAVENGRPLIRAANTGISGYIDPRGRVVRALPVSSDGVMVVDVPFYSGPDTFYSRAGDVFGMAMFAVAMLSLLVIVI